MTNSIWSTRSESLHVDEDAHGAWVDVDDLNDREAFDARNALIEFGVGPKNLIQRGFRGLVNEGAYQPPAQ